MKNSILTLLFLALLMSANAQIRNRDSIVAGSLYSAQFGAYAVGGDWAGRYNNSYGIGAGYDYKTHTNWLFGANFLYHFGNSFTGGDPFADIRLENGELLALSGDYASVRANQAGWTVKVNVGKIIPIMGPNPNSGLLIQFGAGYVRHKLNIINPGETMPNINGEYGKGYDELHSGLLTSQYIAYAHLGNRRLVNFTAGFEFMQGFTQNARGYNYGLRQVDNQSKLDLYFGAKITWIFPVYSKNQQKFYYY